MGRGWFSFLLSGFLFSAFSSEKRLIIQITEQPSFFVESDGVGGACAIEAESTGNIAIYHYSKTGKKTLLVKDNDPILKNYSILGTRKIYSNQPDPPLLACDEREVVFFGYDKRGFIDIFVKKYEGPLQILLKQNDTFPRFLVFSQKRDFAQYKFGFKPYSSAGYIILAIFVITDKTPLGFMAPNTILFSNDSFKVFYDLDEFPDDNSASSGLFTRNYFWNLRNSKVGETSLWQMSFDGVYRKVFSNVPLKHGIASNSEQVVLSFKDESGNYYFYRFRENDLKPQSLLLSQKTTEGVPLSDSISHTLTEDGMLVFIMNDGSKNYLVELGPQPGVPRIVKNSFEKPFGSVEIVKASANRYYFLLRESGMFSSKRIYLVLKPKVPAQVEGIIGEEITFSCVDCFWADKIKPRLFLNAKELPLRISNSESLTFKIPEDISPGNYNLELKIDQLSFTIVLKTKEIPVVPAIVERVVSATFKKEKNIFAPGELLTIFGKNLCGLLSDSISSINQAISLPWPRELALTRVLLDNKPLPISFAFSSKKDGSSQINFQLPTDIKDGTYKLSVERLKSDGSIETNSNTVLIEIVRIKPSFFGNQKYPVFLQNISQDLTGQTFVSGETPARPGDVLILYGTGFGPTDPPLKEGEGAGYKMAKVIEEINVWAKVGINNEWIWWRVKNFGVFASPQFPGLYQLAIQIPEDIRPDEKGLIYLVILGKDFSIEIPLNLL